MTKLGGNGELALLICNLLCLLVFYFIARGPFVGLDFLQNRRKAHIFSSFLYATLVLFSSYIYVILLRAINNKLKIFSVLYKFLSLFQNWWPSKEMWLDSNIISHSVSCGKYVDLYKPNKCFGFLWNYPALYKYLPNFVGWHPGLLQFLAIFGAFITYFFAFYLSNYRIFITLLFLLSPGFLFAFERANLEYWVLIFCLIASFLFQKIQNDHNVLKSTRFLILFSFFLVLLIGLLIKFYPIGLIVIFFSMSSLKWLKYLLSMVLLLYLFISIKYLDLLKFYPNAPSPHRHSYGLNTLVSAFINLNFTEVCVAVIIIYFFLNVGLADIGLLFKKLDETAYRLDLNDAVFLPSILLFFGVFLLGGNTLYRSILLLPSIFLSSEFVSNRFIMLLSVIVAWTSPFDFISNITIIILFIFTLTIYSIWVIRPSLKSLLSSDFLRNRFLFFFGR